MYADPNPTKDEMMYGQTTNVAIANVESDEIEIDELDEGQLGSMSGGKDAFSNAFETLFEAY